MRAQFCYINGFNADNWIKIEFYISLMFDGKNSEVWSLLFYIGCIIECERSELVYILPSTSGQVQKI